MLRTIAKIAKDTPPQSLIKEEEDVQNLGCFFKKSKAQPTRRRDCALKTLFAMHADELSMEQRLSFKYLLFAHAWRLPILLPALAIRCADAQTTTQMYHICNISSQHRKLSRFQRSYSKLPIHLAPPSSSTRKVRFFFFNTCSHKMKEAIVSAGPTGPTVQIVDSPLPIPEPDQVVIQVVVSGSNPKDYKMPLPQQQGRSFNSGDDIAGVVHSVGSNVVEFKPGDRVAAFHEISAPGGSYAEYAVSWSHTTFHLPKKTTFEGPSSFSSVVPKACKGIWVLTDFKFAPRGRYDSATRHHGGIWSLSVPWSSATMASSDYHISPSNHLRRRISCWFLCDPASPTIQHSSVNLYCRKRYPSCGETDR